MLPGYPGEHITRAEPWRGIVPTVHSVLAVCLPSLGGLSKEPHLHDGDGVSTYLALTFGTLLSSQGTDASFGLPSRASSGRFPSVLRFRLYQILSALIFAGAIRPFGFFAVPTLPDPFPSPAPCWSGVSAVSLSLFGLSAFISSSFVPFCFSKSCGRFEFRAAS